MNEIIPGNPNDKNELDLSLDFGLHTYRLKEMCIFANGLYYLSRLKCHYQAKQRENVQNYSLDSKNEAKSAYLASIFLHFT